MQRLGIGFLLVAAGAVLWGTDGLFRRALAFEMPAPAVVAWEHVILVVLTMPLLIRFLRNRPQLERKDLVALLFVGAGASAVATIFFTQAFAYGDPTTPLLIQKTQPVIAVLGAYLLLGERLLPRYGWYFLFAVGGAYLIAFPDPSSVGVSRLAPALLALGAAALWGMGTVLGRHLTHKIPTQELTALRFAIGLPTALLIVLLRGEVGAVIDVSINQLWALALLSLVPGLAALMIYYRGLSSTPASSATLAELAFPLTAILIGWSVFDTVPTGTQWAGIAVLSATIIVMSRAAQKGAEALGVRALQPAVETGVSR
ncbi:MAG TPA: DMT family transporter [Acidimicrobiia bacterium]|nr:DMT family transporter [Acidimicrobiia bacterium]